MTFACTADTAFAASAAVGASGCAGGAGNGGSASAPLKPSVSRRLVRRGGTGSGSLMSRDVCVSRTLRGVCAAGGERATEREGTPLLVLDLDETQPIEDGSGRDSPRGNRRVGRITVAFVRDEAWRCDGSGTLLWRNGQ